MNLAGFLANRSPILLDGAMGTELAAGGLEMGGHNCLSCPDCVLAVHKEYSRVGCDILVTNTLTMNRIYRGSRRGRGRERSESRRRVTLAGSPPWW